MLSLTLSVYAYLSPGVTSNLSLSVSLSLCLSLPLFSHFLAPSISFSVFTHALALLSLILFFLLTLSFHRLSLYSYWYLFPDQSHFPLLLFSSLFFTCHLLSAILLTTKFSFFCSHRISFYLSLSLSSLSFFSHSYSLSLSLSLSLSSSSFIL